MLASRLPRTYLYPCAGMACSACLHSLLAVLGVGLWLWGLDLFAEPATGQVELVVAPVHSTGEIELAATFTPGNEQSDPRPVDTDDVLARLSDPQWQELVEPVPVAEVPHAGLLVTREIARITRAADQRSVDENLERLDDLSQRLSSTDAVDDINSQLRNVLQTEARAERPAEQPVAGEFDFTTAQLHEVLKKDDASGNLVYVAVLVDAAGRKFESPMGHSEGETAYRTMQLIKSNPLLERVYRGVVMSMMDQVLKNAR